MPGSQGIRKSVTLTCGGATQYSAGDVVGGIATFGGVFGVEGTAVLIAVTVKENGSQKPGLRIYFFDRLPAGPYTDNAALSWNSADMAGLLDVVNVTADTDYTLIDSRAIVTKEITRVVAANAGGSSLYAVVVATGTPTLAANGLELTVQLLRDD